MSPSKIARRAPPIRPALNPLPSIAALLSSVLLLVGGNALIGVLTPVRARLDGLSELTVGLLGSAYFAGMLAGTLAAPAIVRRAGHIRAFAAFVALALVSILVMPVWPVAGPWLASRALLGFVFAGIYAVIETWINAKATNANRGALYAIYQIVNFVGSAGGQLSLRPLRAEGFQGFAVAGILFALAIVPMAMTSVDPPAAPRSIRPRLIWLARLAPVSFAAAFAAGAANGAAFALGPVFALDIGMTPETAPFFTASLVIGSALGVYPIGRLSDAIDRRLVIVVVMALGVASELALSFVGHPGPAALALGFATGLTTYSLYTLACSYANDRGKPHDFVQISVGLLFVYCVAAIAAPTLASIGMRAYGPAALFRQNAIIHIAIVGFTLWLIASGRNATKPTPEALSEASRPAE